MDNARIEHLYEEARRMSRVLFKVDRDGNAIREDAVQEAMLAVLENPTDKPDNQVMWDTIKNMRDRYRERGYKVQLWQYSTDYGWDSEENEADEL